MLSIKTFLRFTPVYVAINSVWVRFFQLTDRQGQGGLIILLTCLVYVCIGFVRQLYLISAPLLLLSHTFWFCLAICMTT